ncbi:MAG: nucleotidyltransferase [Epsilonproteobacteria bacterium]|nr:MAG: nucleotidyltransferase [Campylobacterota bacterium]
MSKIQIDIPIGKIEIFCIKWKVRELSFFGSVLRDDFDPVKSDLDILVLFNEKAGTTLFDLVEMKDELEILFKRKVDLISKRGIQESTNPYRKKEILESAKVIYIEAT